MVVKAESVSPCEIIDRKYTARYALGAKPLGTGADAERLGMQTLPNFKHW